VRVVVEIQSNQHVFGANEAGTATPHDWSNAENSKAMP
jgi:hypothetical protein